MTVDVRYAAGFILRGCQHPETPTAVAPVLFTSSHLAAISGGTGNLTAPQFAGRIPLRKDALDGYTSQVNLREPFSAGGNLRVKFADKAPETTAQKDFSQLFAADMPQTTTKSWRLHSNVAYLSKTNASFRIEGPSIAVGDFLYCENEAMRVNSSSNPLLNIWLVGVTRGSLGTRAQEHTIDPSKIPPGDNGSAAKIVFTDRPNYDDYSFEAELHHFSLDGQTATKIDSYYRMTDGRPVPEGDEWIVQTKDFAKIVMEHEAKRPAVTLSHCIQVLDEDNANQGGYQSSTATILQPPNIYVYLTKREAETLFNRRLSVVGSEVLQASEVTTLRTRYLLTSNKLRTELLIDVGGYKWVYQIDNIAHLVSVSWDDDLDVSMVRLSCSLVSAAAGASVKDNPKGVPEGAFEVEPGREATYNEGWSAIDANSTQPEQEKPPVVSLRIWLDNMRPIERLLTLMISKHGGGIAHATYDIIPGEVCPGVDPAFFNLVAGLTDPLAIDTATHKLLEIDALLTTTESVPLDLAEGFKLGPEINRTCRLFGLIRADVPDGLTLRLLERGITGAPTDVQQVVGKGFLIKVGQRLPAEKALIFEGGFDPVTLKPKWEQAAYVLNASAKDLANATRIRLWQQGYSQSLEQLFAGPIGKCMQLAILSAKGSPATYRVTTHRPVAARYAGDLVLWTDNSIPTPAGRGIANLRMKVIGRDVELFSGDQTLLLLPDNLNTLTASEGFLAPALRIVASEVSDTLDVSCFVELLGDDDGSFDITTTLGIYQTLSANSGYVRVINEEGHNPSSERAGWLEMSARVGGIGYDAAGRNLIELAPNGAWERAGYTIADIVAPGVSYLVLQDLRNEANPLGIAIVPDVDQGPLGFDFAWIAPSDGMPPNNTSFFRSLTKIQDL
jgi:hypothetical protein